MLDLSENHFSGSVPTWIGDKLSNLVVLSLRSNNFDGYIPRKICDLQFLQNLDLGHNNISGVIPKCFSNLSEMATKNKTNNELSTPYFIDYPFYLKALLVLKGREDEYGSTLGLVTSLDLSANRLRGEIPKEIGSLVGLLSLNFSGNLLTGNIPDNIGNMELMESLDLSMNRLNGEIPPSFSNLNFLNHFNVSYNNLTGHIPTSTQLQIASNGRYHAIYILDYLCDQAEKYKTERDLAQETLARKEEELAKKGNYRWNNDPTPSPTICFSFCHANSNVLCIESEGEGGDFCKWIGVVCHNSTGHVNQLHLAAAALSAPDFDAPPAEWEAYERSKLRGKINPSLLELKHLGSLDFSNNNFSSIQIPKFFGLLESLTYLNLSRKQFQGAIPHNLGNLSKLQYLDLRTTDWLQVAFKHPSLLELHLSACSLEDDPSPMGVNSTKSRVVLGLSENNFSSVPMSIFGLQGLVSIDLCWCINRKIKAKKSKETDEKKFEQEDD
ncbi:receptor-like protein EIX1 [Gossypium hirsutum]|uniref:Receptor-like protein EIX1 n=1 Tax=Gossypium hirsutum TaxID=3635 RepID=A0ABM3AZW5_GOSHI|nr:receptor-like protein EIX1 [Gossypium hirsutum]